MTSPAASPSPRPASPATDGAPAAKRQKVDHEASNDEPESASPGARSESEEPSAEEAEEMRSRLAVFMLRMRSSKLWTSSLEIYDPVCVTVYI